MVGRKIVLAVFIFVASFPFTMGALRAENLGEGKKLYQLYCSNCHGDSGKGDGPAARSLPVKPVNHGEGKVMNELSDQFMFNIISKGGKAVGKSPFMPGWGNQLKKKQIRDLISYVRSLAVPPYQSSEKN